MIQTAVEKRAKRIDSLTGLKVICLLLIFLWHGPFPHPKTDIGARTCEFLFLASGFLVAYNGFYKEVHASWAESFHYVGKKLAAFWPLHAIAMLAVMCAAGGPILTRKNLINGAINLLLLQAWSGKTTFSYNGATWFLSALLFCYFLAPFLLRLAKNIRTSCFLFVFIYLARTAVEYVVTAFPGEFWSISIHSFPIIRALEFAMGMMLVPLFMRINERDWGEHAYLAMSAIEIAALAGALWATIHYNGIWRRSGFLLPYSALLFVFAFDRGLLSRLLSWKAVKRFSEIQFEFFILHQAIITCLAPPLKRVIPKWSVGAVLFLITVILAMLYKKYLSKALSAHYVRIQNAVLRILQIDLY